MTPKEFSLSEEREKLRKDIDYLFSKINWGSSFLDAKAIQIMNEFWKDLINSDKEFIKIIKHDIKVWTTEAYFKKIKRIIDKLAGDKLI